MIEKIVEIHSNYLKIWLSESENELNELNQEIKEVGIGSAAFETAAGNIQKLESELKGAQQTTEQ